MEGEVGVQKYFPYTVPSTNHSMSIKHLFIGGSLSVRYLFLLIGVNISICSNGLLNYPSHMSVLMYCCSKCGFAANIFFRASKGDWEHLLAIYECTTLQRSYGCCLAAHEHTLSNSALTYMYVYTYMYKLVVAK